jgi:thiol-disulfide isomerase/thioredoxin
MKKIIASLIILFVAGQSMAQQFEQFYDDKGKKIAKGLITRELLKSDTAYAWYGENEKNYKPNAAAVAALQENKDKIQVIVFGGTWCDDTRYILPKFYMITDAAGFDHDRISLIGVDRSKKTISHLAEALAITNVPTIIIMKDGKELGRVVEYGKMGMWDKEIADVITAAKQ